MAEGRAPRIPQNDSKATYTRRRHQEDGIIDWKQTSLSVYNWIRALTIPFPGALTYWKGERIILWESELLRGYKAQFDARPGEILDRLSGRGMVVATGDYCLLIKMVEVDGKRMRGDEFMQRFNVNTGLILEK
jgi:methionyl-tRNA formyltransferase